MTTKLSYFYLIIGLMLTLIYHEAIIGFATSGELVLFGSIHGLLFSVPFALLLFLVSTVVSGPPNKLLVSTLLLVSAFIFSSQLVYFKVFKTFYYIYSAGNASQVFEFWRETLMVMLRNTHWLLLLFLPGALLLIFRREIPLPRAIPWSFRFLVVVFLAIAHLLGVAAVYYGDRGAHSAYDLYYQSSYPVAMVNRFGLLTTMRLDLQRTLLGWSPKIELPDDLFPDEPPPNTQRHNVLELDFERLLAEETDEELQDLHRYFSLVPASEKNEYTGKYKGYNLVLVTAESFSSFAVKPDVTPTLYKLVNEGYKFTDFYNPYWGVSTSDGEYVACVGLIPKSGVWSMFMSGSNYLPFTMGNQLQKLGYKTMAYHNHDHDFYRRHISHPNLGYEFKAIGLGLELTPGWPASDLEMMELTIPEFIDSQPFHTYYITVSGHHQYNFQRNDIAIKNKHLVEDLPYSTTAQAYLATQIELDRALEYLLEKLEEAGIADNTLIVLSADHYPYALDHSVMEELAGHPVEGHFELYQSPLIIYTKGMEPETIDKPCSSLDILPTISNLLGLEFDSRLLMGTDIFSSADPIITFVDSSFITSKGRYNSRTGEFSPVLGVDIEDDYLERMIAIIRAKFYYSAKVLETDYYRHILGD